MAPAPRIVVADDSPFMRTVLGGALGAAGFDVVGTARDGDEALAQGRAARPDAMTLDLAMPGLDGLGVLRALKESGAPDVPVIVVSAFSPAHGARAVDALAEGAFDLVPKPAVGEPFHTFTENLAERLRQAVAQASTAPLVGNGNGNGHAAPAPRAPPGRPPRRSGERGRAPPPPLPRPARPCPPPARPARSSSPPPPAARARSPSCCPRSLTASARARSSSSTCRPASPARWRRAWIACRRCTSARPPSATSSSPAPP